MTRNPPNRLKQKLRAGEPALGYWLSLNSIAITEMAAGAGWDWLLLDTEHAIYNDETVERHVLAASHGGPAELVVRLPNVDANLVKRLLDAGVRSFMFPFVQTVEEAKLAVAATRYPPHGIRGFSSVSRANHWGRDTGYLQNYADDICVIIQIESRQAVANIAAYGAIEGIDAMLIGANDLAADMGHLGNGGHADVINTVEAAGAAIRATGKAAGFLGFDERATQLLKQGFTLAAVAGDISSVAKAMAARLAELK